MFSTFNLRPCQKVSGDDAGARTDQCKNKIGAMYNKKRPLLGGKFQGVRQFAGVKGLTNIMSA